MYSNVLTTLGNAARCHSDKRGAILIIAIIIGTGFVFWPGSLFPILMILIVAKTIMEFKLHRKERLEAAVTT